MTSTTINKYFSKSPDKCPNKQKAIRNCYSIHKLGQKSRLNRSTPPKSPSKPSPPSSPNKEVDSNTQAREDKLDSSSPNSSPNSGQKRPKPDENWSDSPLPDDMDSSHKTSETEPVNTPPLIIPQMATPSTILPNRRNKYK